MTVWVRRNPFDANHKERHVISAEKSLTELADSLRVRRSRVPVMASVNGRWVLHRDWDGVRVGPSDEVIYNVMPRGGGGGGGGGGGAGKQIMAAVALVVVAAAAVYTGGLAAGALSGAGLIGAAGSASYIAVSAGVTALVAAGGSLLVNSIIPPQRAAQGNLGAGDLAGTSAAVSPTYTLAARSNTARLNQPIPVLYGTHLIYPDYLATPYWEFNNSNEQILYQIFVIGQGEYTLTDLKIGTADVSVYDSITVQVHAPGSAITEFDTNVYTSPDIFGQTLQGPNELLVGDPGYIGPFPICPPDSTCTYVGIDISLSRGLYTSSGTTLSNNTVNWTVEARPIDSNGVPTGAGTWTTVASPSLTLATSTSQRKSYKYNLGADSRYEVRLKRTNNKDLLITSANELEWAGMRGYITDGPTTYADITTVTMITKATNNISTSNTNKFNVIAARKLRSFTVVDGAVVWGALAATRSLAYAVADILVNDVYGGNIKESRIDFDGLLELHSTWVSRGDNFDGVFDQPTTVWDAITRALRCGRAKPYTQAGMIRFHRDGPQTVPVAVFSQSNIVAGSFSMTFAMQTSDDMVDGVEAEFLEERTWRPAVLTAGVGGATPVRTVREQLFGIVNGDHAQREADYMAASNRYRRVFVSLTTELEGRIPSFGDYVLLGHEVPKWGKSGVVLDWDADNLLVTLDVDLDLPETGSGHLYFRDRNGIPSTAVTIVSRQGTGIFLLATAPKRAGTSLDIVFNTDGQSENTHYVYGTSTETMRGAIVTGVTPRGDTIEMSFVLEDSRVHVN